MLKFLKDNLEKLSSLEEDLALLADPDGKL
jgi:hypothetical protein